MINLKMKSQNLINIEKVDESKKKKVLFVNAKRRDCQSIVPHNGLAILAGILKKRGHEVLIVDYQLIHNAPDISSFIYNFKPDIICVSVYSASFFEAEKIISKINKINENIPLIVGGPHATIYPDLLQKNKRIDYINIGEAELTIIDLVEKAKKEKEAKFVESTELVNLDDMPFPDYNSFYKSDYIRSYPIMTSRGCPFNCSFCIISSFSRKWRPRKPENCIEELELAKRNLSNDLNIVIQDDNPLVDKKRFFEFLELFKKKINLRFSIMNTRADSIDEPLLQKLKENKCESICISLESADPEVFLIANKQESFKQIENAATLIKKSGLNLLFSFIIGLPKDNLNKMKKNIEFVNKYKPIDVFWNMVLPFRNTWIRKWFEENGKIYNEIGKTSYIEGDFICEEPPVETPDFSIYDRKKAYYLCILKTADNRLKLRKLFRIAKISYQYGLILPFLGWFPRGVAKSINNKYKLLKKGKAYYKREGFNQLLKRISYLISSKRI